MTTQSLGLRCMHCDEPVLFDSVKGWIHAADGHPYKGECRCEGARHPYSHDARGQLICRTWRDNHIAMPRRS